MGGGGRRQEVYGELCCPKASNSGSMKRKKKREGTAAELRSQGVDCQLDSSISHTGDILYPYSTRAPTYVTNVNYS
jgi:hypothetical protein